MQKPVRLKLQDELVNHHFMVSIFLPKANSVKQTVFKCILRTLYNFWHYTISFYSKINLIFPISYLILPKLFQEKAVIVNNFKKIHLCELIKIIISCTVTHEILIHVHKGKQTLNLHSTIFKHFPSA